MKLRYKKISVGELNLGNVDIDAEKIINVLVDPTNNTLFLVFYIPL